MKFFNKLKLVSRWIRNQKTTAAIDVTSYCNLKCTHCYWWKEEHPPELNDEEMIAFMKGLRRQGLTAAFLYGGEPLLRPDMCKAACEIFDFTLIFTNGTQGFPNLKCQWVLSLDGPQEIHDQIRGEGVYQRVMQNLGQATRPPIVHMTISQANKNSIADFLKEMEQEEIKSKILGLAFSFYTPNKGLKEEELFIPLDERDELVDKLLEYRREYGSTMGFTPKMAKHFKQSGSFFEWNSLEKCPVGKVCVCYRSDGTRKPCTYGVDADCSRCGCASIAIYRAAVKDWDFETITILNRLINGCA